MNTRRMGNTGASLYPPDNLHSDEVALEPSISLMLSANENEYIEGKLSTSDQKNTVFSQILGQDMYSSGFPGFSVGTRWVNYSEGETYKVWLVGKQYVKEWVNGKSHI